MNVDSNIKETRVPLEGHLQGTRMLGTSTAALSNDRLHKRFKGLFKEHTLESSAKTLRGPKVKGELSRFKLRKEVQEMLSLYISVYPVHGPSSVLSGKTKMDIKGRWSVR